MPGPISREVNSSNLEQNQSIDPSMTSSAPQATQAARPQDQVSQYQCDVSDTVSHGPSPEAAGPTLSPQELQLQAAKAFKKRENAIDALANVLPKLEQVANAHDADVGRYNSTLNDFALAAQKDPAFRQLLKDFPREEISDAIHRLVQRSNPEVTEAQVGSIVARLVHEIDLNVMVDTAQKAKKAVVAQLDTAAANFKAAANDPAQLEQIAGTLAKLEAPSASASQKAEAQALREALGLPADATPVSRLQIGAALLARSELISHEAHHMTEAGEGTLYRNLLLHSQALRAEAGVSAGSWAASAVDLVHARGEADESAIKVAKLTSAIALGVASGGMGLGVALSAGMTAAFNAPGVLNAWKEVNHARAGVSAGTADETAVTRAQRRAVIETAELALSTVASGALASGHGVLPALKGVPELDVAVTAGHALKDGATEAVIGGAAIGVEHLTAPTAKGSRGDGVSRARTAAK